ncbi:glucosamine-6-phosphate deaminase, partial [Enterococcus faecalis]
FMHIHLFHKKTFKKTFVLIGKVEDLDAAYVEYEKIIDAHAVDIQILGIDQNVHIDFNVPGTPLDSFTHVVELSESTVNAN